MKNSELSFGLGLLLSQLGLFIAGQPDAPHGVAWCFSSQFPHKVAKWIDELGYIGHRPDHVLELIPESEFPNLYAPGWRGKIARATYQYVRSKLQPQDLVLEIARFNGVLDESLKKTKQVHRCGSCAFFRTPACTSSNPVTVWFSGEACDLFYPFRTRLKQHLASIKHISE